MNDKNDVIDKKEFGFFKRNKKFILSVIPFLVVAIIMAILNIWSEWNRIWKLHNTILPISRIVFAVLYAIFMHVFLHSTNGKFSTYEITDERLIKKDKIKNSILLIIPILITLVGSLYNFISNMRYYTFSFWWYDDNVRQTIDLLVAANSFVLMAFIVYMYKRNKLNLRKTDDGLNPRKNKRLISWAYIWRFLLLVGLTIIAISFLSDKITDFVARSKVDMYESLVDSGSTSLMSLAIMKLYDAIPALLACSFVLLLSLIIGTISINHIVKKKAVIEKQNVKYIKKSVFAIIIIVFAFLIISVFSSAKDSLFNYSDLERELTKGYENYLDMKDLCEHEIMGYNSANVLESIDMIFKGFEVSKLTDFYNKFYYPYIITYIVCLVLVGCFIILYTKKQIDKNSVENSLDENGNIIPTQNKLVPEYRSIFIFIHVFNLLLVSALYTIYNIQTIEDNQESKQPLITNIEYESSNNINTDTSGDTEVEEEYDEAYLNWIKLEHDDAWYLENKISYKEAIKYALSHEEFNGDREYVLSMKNEAEKFSQEVMKYDTLFEAENGLNIEFNHIAPCEWAYIIDDKNYLTGIGVVVKVDDFTHRNIISCEPYDYYNILKK